MTIDTKQQLPEASKVVGLAALAGLALFLLTIIVLPLRGQLPPFPKLFRTDTNAAPVMSAVEIPLVVALAAPEVPRNGVVKLAWDRSPDASVTGYRVYWGGATGSYTNSRAVGNTTNVTIAPLIEGVNYYFAASAYDATGAESPFSNEVKFMAAVEIALQMSGWKVSTPGYFGKTNEIVTSVDGLKTWVVLKTFTGNGTAQSVSVTNSTAAYYRVRVKGQT